MDDKDRLDRVFSSAPMNKQAALVTGVGVAPVQRPKQVQERRWDICPELKPYLGPPEFDLTGKTFGQFRVMGSFGKSGQSSGMRWVVRCFCGYYEVRQSRVLKNPGPSHNLCCTECDYADQLRKGKINNTIRAEQRKLKGYV